MAYYHLNGTPSIQQQLFSLLNDQQKAVVAKNLWPLKGCAQAILCQSLVDFIVNGEVHEPQNVVLSIIYDFLTGEDMYEGYEAPLFILPETYRPSEAIFPNLSFDKGEGRC